MTLRELDLHVSESPLPDEVTKWIAACRDRINEYWDSFKNNPLPQYVECDFDYVAMSIRAVVESGLLDGRLFMEWGCGFATITGVASLFGLDAIGIEVEAYLVEEAQKLLNEQGVAAEIWQGNCLPRGSHKLALNTDPSNTLSHDVPPAYDENGMGLEDFALVFVYPWPGEEHFLKSVFDKFARSGAHLLLFRGPFHVEFYRKH